MKFKVFVDDNFYYMDESHRYKLGEFNYVEVREDILHEINGPMLKYGLQKLHHQKILLP